MLFPAMLLQFVIQEQNKIFDRLKISQILTPCHMDGAVSHFPGFPEQCIFQDVFLAVKDDQPAFPAAKCIHVF